MYVIKKKIIRFFFVCHVLVFNLWKKRDFAHDRKKLESHPSLLQYIAGSNTQNEAVVKIFYRDDNTDKEFESFCKNCCTVSDDTKFEFVSVPKDSKTFKKVSTLEVKKKPSMDDSDKKRLGLFIKENEDKIFASYSNVIGIGIGVNRFDNKPQDEPCIVLYCLDKNIIPFGEQPLPTSLKGLPCDIREDFVRFGKCPNECPALNRNFPEPGCNIIAQHGSTGSVGFLVEDQNSPTYCFLTASHVVIEDYQKFYRETFTFPLTKPTNSNCIVHRSCQETTSDVEVGEVTKYFFGNYQSEQGLDIALVEGKLVRTEGEV